MDKIPLLDLPSRGPQGEDNNSFQPPPSFYFMNVHNDNSFRTLCDAVQSNNISKIQKILQQRHPTLIDSSGTTILHIGIQWANEDTLKLLLQYPSVQRLKNRADENGMTPLICAARYDKFFAAAMLCSIGVDVTRTVHRMRESALHYAACHQDPRLTKLLLQHNSLPEFINASNADGNTPLAVAAENKSPATSHLLNAGADITNQNRLNGRTMLHVTIAYDNIDLFKKLLANPACDKSLIGQINFEKDSPLMLAVKLGKLEFVKLLVDKNLDYDGINQNLCETVLHRAIRINRVDILREILQHCSKDFLEYPDEMGRAPLLLAAELDNVECFNELLENGADIMILNKRTDENVLHSAIRMKSEKIVSNLMTSHTDVTSFFYLKDCEGNTPLMTAIRSNNEICLLELLQAGWYYTHEVNAEGDTALYHAAENGFYNIVRFLLLSEHYYTFCREHKNNININDNDVILEAEIRGDIHASDVYVLLGVKVKYELYPWRAKALLKRSAGDRNLFHACALGGNIDCLQFIYSYYVNFKYDMNDFDAKCDTGDTPLLLALQCGMSSLACVNFFLTHGANMAVSNNAGLDVFKAFNLHLPEQEHLWSNVLDTCVSLRVKHLNKYVDVDFSILCAPNDNQMKITRLLYDKLRDTSKRHILMHPVLELFILLKFKKIKRLMFMRFVFYAVFTLCVTVLLSIYLMSSERYIEKYYRGCLILFLVYGLYGICLSLPHILVERSPVKWFLSIYPSFGIMYLLFGGRTLPFVLENIGCTILVSWLLLLLYAAETFSSLSHQFAMFSHIVNNITKYFLVLWVILIAFSVCFFCLFRDDAKFSNPFISFVYTSLIMLPGRMDELPIFSSEGGKNPHVDSSMLLFLLQFSICLLFLFIAVIAMLNMLVGLAIRGGHTLEVDGDIILNYIQACWVNDYELLFETKLYKCLEKFRLGLLIGVPRNLRNEINIPLFARVKHKHRDMYPAGLLGNLTKLSFKRNAEMEEDDSKQFSHWKRDKENIKKCLHDLGADPMKETVANIWTNIQNLEYTVWEQSL